ncbi:thiamine pyrophosphate-binding protein [Cellulomonas iranensis]|uniref:Phosphonopyruvate decarboxylase n=1 Tax=Cellulomonas iranensis TaxID=76862 RepID=A0ABU0GH41_9CELL|nr:thiamine pyrophosphate-binding protein [Cellulomonas iranensis]MDQ0424647.1 phosphonopyruvate decarboxylase [Cellulomonas iranensis]
MSVPTVTATAQKVLAALVHEGVDWATGVPCSLLAGVFAELEAGVAEIDYVPAPREDTAVGLAVGAALAGRRPVVLMQNSGLGYCLNVLTSLTLIYGIHPFLVVSWRGHDGRDAVEHDVIGRELVALLDVVAIAPVVLDEARPGRSVRAVAAHLEAGRPAALLVTRGL